MLKADFHIHSRYSGDCSTTLEQIIETCLKKNINCVALTDHNEIEGALKLQKMAPFKVIVGEEILTTSGEVMGLFLTSRIPRDLPLEEVIRRIKDQGGLVCAQHPFDKFRSDALQADVMEKFKEQIDLVEVFNARTPLNITSEKARQFAEKNHLPASAGSDAHSASEIGIAYVELPEFNGREDFLAALSQGKIYGHRTSPVTHFKSLWARVKKLAGKGKID
ncbi:MAG TPA: PHP domain-containing protein [Dehalococcoidales bacterium]|nr:PHP domain-containing protein [Dehalococcoidales bacterium]